MMGRIQQLLPEVSNKIAAGEVVERPASVVKELLENALDARASRVAIALVDAGKTLIRVTDNGEGIHPQDLELALAAHATSKIRSAEDLFGVETNGFRGEALASIASVSRVRLVSKRAQDPHAGEVTSDGGKQGPSRACAAQDGTTIEVRDLFFNLPARRKWLKSDSTEFSHTLDLVQAIALANPEVALRLSHGERVAFDLPAQSQSERLMALYGDLFAEGMLELHEHETYAALDGFLAPPGTHRPNSRGLQLYVNRRPIRDRALMQAVMLAYREFLPPGRFPVAYLFLRVDPATVDVNVHPAKTEVRFLEQNRLFALIKSAITERLIGSGVLPRLSFARPAPAQGYGPQARPDSPFEPVGELTAAPPGQMFSAEALIGARAAEQRWAEARSVLAQVIESAPRAPAAVAAQEKTAPQPAPDSVSPGTEAARPAASPQGLLAQARGLFQVGQTYIVVETADAVVIIDQHAFHERILYYMLEHRLQSAPLERQRLLMPLPLNLSLAARELALSQREALVEFGFELEPFGPDGSLALTAAPRYSLARKHDEMIVELCEELAQGRRPGDFSTMRKSLVEMVACKAAIKAHDPLSPEQIRDLLRLGETVPHTFTCPHGRPTTYRLAFTDLEKVFHRR
ncbi:DNA mismatch repair endonuclease MutL [bacterium]|nr:MAG: DNA mismatch repair endonuclease MutL [bacterium]RIK63187.1 MAG: DNA mismatch repair endonuclease MutL [Planctomycetota bacterium]